MGAQRYYRLKILDLAFRIQGLEFQLVDLRFGIENTATPPLHYAMCDAVI
jgi:hypothetical protein